MLDDDYGYLYDYTDIKKRLLPCAIKLKQNKSLEKNIPCVKLTSLNMMLVFYADLGLINGYNMKFLITNCHLRLWKVSKKRIIWTAFHNVDAAQK